jgi:uncharacterized coiled-coil protein SlyX
MDERIIELEIRIAHQDRAIAALDDVVRAFTTRVERLEQQIQELRAGGAAPLGPADDPPPHY